MRGASHGADFHAERTTVQCGRAGGSSVISPREDQWPAFLRQASRRSNVAIRYGPIIRIEIQTQSFRLLTRDRAFDYGCQNLRSSYRNVACPNSVYGMHPTSPYTYMYVCKCRSSYYCYSYSLAPIGAPTVRYAIPV